MLCAEKLNNNRTINIRQQDHAHDNLSFQSSPNRRKQYDTNNQEILRFNHAQTKMKTVTDTINVTNTKSLINSISVSNSVSLSNGNEDKDEDNHQHGSEIEKKKEDNTKISENDIDLIMDYKLPAILNNTSLVTRRRTQFSAQNGGEFPKLTSENGNVFPKRIRSVSTDFDYYLQGLSEKDRVSKTRATDSSKTEDVDDMEIFRENIASKQECIKPTGMRKLRRAASETKSPAEHVRMTRELLEMNKQSVLKEPVLYEEEQFHLNIIDENISKLDSSKFNAGVQKSKRFAKLKRSQTEEFVDIRTSPKNERRSSINNSISTRKASSFLYNSHEQEYFLQPPVKPVSKRKQIKRSISMSLTRFKRISNSSHQKFENDEINNMGHETSRRKSYGIDAEDIDSFHANGNFDKKRSISVPIRLDHDESDVDEDLTNLYLPRRMAICPDLPVPAMKQLKTYLILSRLKQYCFV